MAAMQQAMREKNSARAEMSVAEGIEAYIALCRAKGLRPKTVLNYLGTLQLFEKWCKESGIRRIEDVTGKVMGRYVAHLRQRGKYTAYYDIGAMAAAAPEKRKDYAKSLSISTVNDHIRAIKAFFALLEREGITAQTPMADIGLIKTEAKPRIYMDGATLLKLTSSLDRTLFSEHRDYAMIMLLADSGMSPGECAGLRTEDVDLKSRSIHLKGKASKGRRGRTVYFTPDTEKMLRRWISYKARFVESDLLFPTKHNGEPVTVTNFERNFRHYLKRAAIEGSYSPRSLQHSFAKACLDRGMDMYTLSILLGHSTPSVTERAYPGLGVSDPGMRYRMLGPG